MAIQIIQFRADEDLVLKARLYAVGSDTEFAGEATCAEATNRKGLYSFTQSGSAGSYEVKIWDDTGTRYLLGTRFVATTDIAATFECVDQYADLVVASGLSSLLTRIPATLFSGITYLARWLGLLAGKAADSGTLAEVQATTAGAGYSNVTDSLEALRDRGDSGAWGGEGGGGGSGSAVSYVMPLRATAGERLLPGRVELFIKERVPVVLSVVDERGQPVDCSGKTCSLLVQVAGGVAKIDDLSPTGSPPHRYTFTPSEAMVEAQGPLKFALRTPVGSGYEVVSHGVLNVLFAVSE